MRQCWLRTNVRAISLGMILPTVVLLGGFALALGLPTDGLVLQTLHWLGWGMVSLAAIALVTLLYLMRQPRLAFQDDHLLVYLRSTEPIRVPIEIVECFFLGQSSSMLDGQDIESETATVVVRLAEASKSWQQMDVKPALGQWCDGHITIRGTWCEPLRKEVLKRLNANLVNVQRQQRETESV